MGRTMRTSLASLLLALLVTAFVTGVVTTLIAPATASGTVVKAVAIKNFAFSPRTITVKVGTRVKWTNRDTAIHRLASATSIKTSAKLTAMFRSGSLSKGQSFSFTFKKKGTFFYLCIPHRSMASMHGKVVVI
jgi:plastocyanin